MSRLQVTEELLAPLRRAVAILDEQPEAVAEVGLQWTTSQGERVDVLVDRHETRRLVVHTASGRRTLFVHPDVVRDGLPA